jgi:cobalt-zinc-cadmium efflux system outer membrane protein
LPRFRRSSLAVLTAFLFLPSRLRAADALTLPEALRISAERNVDLLSARADVSQAEAQRQLASQVSNPALSLSTAKIPTDGRSASTELGNGFFDRSYDTIVSLSQPLEIGGKRSSRRRSAEAGMDAARSRLLDTSRSVSSDVVRAYVLALAAREGANLLEASATSLETSARLAGTREEHGEISLADRLQVEVAAGRFRGEAEAAQARARGAVLALQGLLGLSSRDPDLRLSTDLEAAAKLTAAFSSSITAPDETALDRRPDVSAARAGEAKATAERSLQKALRIPDPTFLVQYEREPPDRPNSVGFGVALPLPFWNRNKAGVSGADAALESARVETQRVIERARTELAVTREALSAAETRATRYEKEILPRARAARDAVAFAWREGGASLLELLEAERSAADVQLAASAARADLLSTRADWAAARALPLLPEESR